MPKNTGTIVPQSLRSRFAQALTSTNGHHKRPKGDGARQVEDAGNHAASAEPSVLAGIPGIEEACAKHAASAVTFEDELPAPGRSLPNRSELRKVARRSLAEMEAPSTELVSVEADPLTEDSGRTEVANAKRLIEMCGSLIRYVTEWKEWLVWDGRRWKRDTGGVGVEEKAADVADGLWAQIARGDKLNQGVTRQMTQFATASNSAKGIAHMIALARVHVAISAGRLDTDPWLLNCANGTVDLRTGELWHSRPINHLTKLCPTAFEYEARCPTWERFLNDVFAGDAELIGYVRRLLGYGLTGDVREQLLPVLWGEGSNGKSTLVNAVMHALGDDYGGSPPRELFTVQRFGTPHPTNLMTLQGKRLMVAQETEAGARLNEALIKHLTGGDKVTARGMYQDFSSFDPTHKLLLCTNHKPQVRGTDHAMWRRLKLVPFAVRFAGHTCDKRLPDKLRAEAPGILAWMVRGCLEWQRGGMDEPQTVAAATQGYATEQDEVGEFLKLCCVAGEGHVAHASQLYAAFKAATPDTDLTQTAFGRELSARGYERGRITKGPHKAQHCWKGLRPAD